MSEKKEARKSEINETMNFGAVLKTGVVKNESKSKNTSMNKNKGKTE